MKHFTKYVLFLLTFIVVAQANITPLKSSYDLRSSEYGARYYDPRTSVWQSPDPILDEYMSGQTNGGVFNPKNLSLFSYTYNNPVNFIDPDGKSTHIDSDGNVFSVNTSDNDLGVYQHASNMCEINPKKVGETKYQDEFISPETDKVYTNHKIEVGKTFDGVIASKHQEAKSMNLIQIGRASKPGRKFDIKKDYPNIGRLLNGKYATSRSAGNFLAAYNAKSGTLFGRHIDFTTFQKMAGALAIEDAHGKSVSNFQLADIALTGSYDGSDNSKFVAPAWGENLYQLRMSKDGWNHESK